MEGVKQVVQQDDTRLSWVAEIAGQKRVWESRITEQTPGRADRLDQPEGTGNAGVVTFHRLDPQTTRVMLQLEVYPTDWLENSRSRPASSSAR
jgi:uncharacterized membrane protein